MPPLPVDNALLKITTRQGVLPVLAFVPSVIILLLSLGLITWLGQYYFTGLGLTVITMLYLLCVLWAAYFLRFAYALGTAVIVFLLINYCFIEPRYSLAIASMQSWVILLVFAILALTVSSVMQRLKQQTQQSQLAAQQSLFFQTLAELLAKQSSTQELLQSTCNLVRDEFGIQTGVIQLPASGALTWLTEQHHSPEVQASSVQWALDYNRPIGAGTHDWPELNVCILPFGFPQREVLVVAVSPALPELHFLQLLTHQCAQAYIQLSQKIALAEAAREASEAQFKKTLLTALSHDMRTPLTAILGSVNVLADQHISLAASQAKQLLASIQAEATYLTQATENILTLVKLETGASGLHLDWQSPQEVIHHVAQRYLRRSPSVALQLQVTEEEVLVRMDAMLVAHALANLIDNAITWRHAESMIEIHLKLDKDWLRVAVVNQGPGFPEDFAISAFATHTQRPAGTRGFGLGLSIVDTIMQSHQGKLEISSTASKTTTVQLLFPYVPASEFISKS